jgi:aminopeptidase N
MFITKTARGFLPGLLLVATAIAAQRPPAERVGSFDVLHYDARVEPSIAERTLKGHVAITFVRRTDDRMIELDSGDLTVDAVREGAGALEFSQQDHRLRIALSQPGELNETRTVEIDYHGAPRAGVHFVPDRSQVFTEFSTSQWLVCINAPDDRATLRLRLVVPGDLAVVASGRLISRHGRPDGTAVHEWTQDRPVPTYTFGFAAGRFTESSEMRGSVRLRYLADGFSQAELNRVFDDTSAMIGFFEERAGRSYDAPSYVQVLAGQGVGQEMSGYTLLPERYGRSVLAGESTAVLGAHELAHQWWGNMVTCRDWTHFWLNEGFATFMAAAYVERRFGRDAYVRQIDLSRARYERLREAGHDRSLVFPTWDHPTADDRTLVYHKGAYVLARLRELLGDGVFWTGIRDYTRTFFGKSVTTVDFENAMERSSRQDLASFFAEWVYLTPTRR